MAPTNLQIRALWAVALRCRFARLGLNVRRLALKEQGSGSLGRTPPSERAVTLESCVIWLSVLGGLKGPILQLWPFF